jgi:putative tricarboxylic transport membrane protein
MLGVPVMVAIGLAGARVWMKVTNIPKSLLAVVVTGICVLGAYSHSNSMYPVWVMIGCGIAGYFLRKVEIPMAPIVLALVLGFMMEVNFRRALIVSDGDISVFLSHPITLAFLILALLTLATPIIRGLRTKGANKE